MSSKNTNVRFLLSRLCRVFCRLTYLFPHISPLFARRAPLGGCKEGKRRTREAKTRRTDVERHLPHSIPFHSAPSSRFAQGMEREDMSERNPTDPDAEWRDVAAPVTSARRMLVPG